MRQRRRIESAIGKAFTVKPEALRTRTLTHEGLLHFALSTGNLDPIYHDQAYADRSPRRRLAPPPTWYTTLIDPNVGAQALYSAGRRDAVRYLDDEPDAAPPGDSGPPHHFLDGLRSFNAALGFRHLSAPRIGDTFTVSGALASVVPKSSQRFGEFVIARSNVNIVNQEGVVLAGGYGSSIVYDLDSLASDSPLGSQGDSPTAAGSVTWPVDAMRQVKRRGAEPRFGEDVQVGDEIDTLFKGTLDLPEIAVFSVQHGVDPEADVEIEAAWNMLKAGDALAAATRYREIAAEPSFGFGVERHLNSSSATSEGAPGAYDIGTQRVAWLAQSVTDWMGDAATLMALDVEIRGFLVVGDAAWCKGVVTDVQPYGHGFLTHLEVWVENQRAQRVSRGTAEVFLPSRTRV